MNFREITDICVECDRIGSAAAVAADATAAAARKALPKYEQKPCSRCDGKGFAHFCGGSRAPGMCFRCAGSGTVIKAAADVRAQKRALAEIEVARLRALYVGAREAFRRATEAGLPESQLRRYRGRLEQIVINGKLAAEALSEGPPRRNSRPRPNGPVLMYRGTRGAAPEATVRKVLSFTPCLEAATIYAASPGDVWANRKASFSETSTVHAALIDASPVLRIGAGGEPFANMGDVLRDLDYGKPLGIQDDEVVRIYNYLHNRLLGRAAGGEFKYQVFDEDGEQLDPEDDEIVPFSISSPQTIFSVFRENMDFMRGDEALVQAGCLVADSFIFADSPTVGKVAQRLGFRGISYMDVFEGSVAAAPVLLGREAESIACLEELVDLDGDDVLCHETLRPLPGADVEYVWHRPAMAPQEPQENPRPNGDLAYYFPETAAGRLKPRRGEDIFEAGGIGYIGNTDGSMVPVSADNLEAMPENIWDSGKLEALVEAAKGYRQVLVYPGYADLWVEDGEVHAQVRDGNHRTFAAIEAGAEFAWVMMSDSTKQALDLREVPEHDKLYRAIRKAQSEYGAPLFKRRRNTIRKGSKFDALLAAEREHAALIKALDEVAGALLVKFGALEDTGYPLKEQLQRPDLFWHLRTGELARQHGTDFIFDTVHASPEGLLEINLEKRRWALHAVLSDLRTEAGLKRAERLDPVTGAVTTR